MKCLRMGLWLSPVGSGRVGLVGCTVLTAGAGPALAHRWAVESLGGLLAGLESETIGFIDGTTF